MTIRRSLQMSIPIVKAFWSKIWLGYVTCVTWVTWPVSRGSPVTPYLDFPTPICLFNHYTTFIEATMAIKSSLQVSIPIVKAFLTGNFVKSKIGQKFAFGAENGVEM